MEKIGILAYGSLIVDPRQELEPVIKRKIPRITTPFSIEFARKSRTRGNAPTLVPVEDGGCPVKGTILVLQGFLTEETAADLVWRRETGNIGTDRHYVRPVDPGPNQVIIEKIENFHEIKIVLFTKLGANIDNPAPEYLAELAINSVARAAPGTDGISYLISAKKQGIRTPLMEQYEQAILMKVGVQSLEEALEIL